MSALFVGAKALEDGQRIYTFRATTDSVDRQGEVVTLDGWDFRNWEANPVILDSHNYFGIDSIVGRGVPPLRLVDGAWEVDVVFSDTPKGQLARKLVDEGSLRAVSVGFNSRKRDRGPDGMMRHLEKELLEVSVVPVPANQEAIRVRSLEGDEPATKAGRVLSSKNEGLLRGAAEAINQVLASLGMPEQPVEEADTEGVEKSAPSELSDEAIGVDLSALRSFVGKKED